MKRLSTLFAALAIVACASTQSPSPISGTSPEITEADLRRRLFLIADDSMMGRESGSEGDYKTADYVAAEFKRLGLEPAGENGTYFQTVPFWRAAVDPQSTLDVRGTTLVVGRDFVPASVFAPARTLDGVPIIYGGVASDTAHWITAAQAEGKVVIIDLPTNTAMRGAVFSTGRWRNAVAVAPVVLDVVGTEQVARLREGRPVPDTARVAGALPTIFITRGAATTMLGADPSTLAPGVTGASLRGHFDIARTAVPFGI